MAKSHPLEKSYPQFAANQVLTHDHLNDLVTYLDGEDRLSRTRLVGVGIVCGLELRSDLSARVVVGRGCGVTTQGDLLVLESDMTLTHRRRYEDPAGYFTGARQPTFPIHELVETPQAPTAGVTRIVDEPDFLKGRVAVLYLEQQRRDLRSCVENDCNEKGRRLILTPRVLVVTRADAAKLALPEDLSFQPPVAPVTLRVPRPAFRDQVAPFGKLDYADVAAAFNGSVVAVEAMLADALQKVIARLQPKLGTVTPSASVVDLIKAAREAVKDGRGMQYLYDWVRDLIATYGELAEVSGLLGAQCCPDKNLFPQHLLLGELEDTLAATYRLPRVPPPPSALRHPFQPSLALSNQVELRQRAASLLQRLVLQLERFSWKPSARIVITPDAGPLAPLERRAPPLYYTLSGNAPSLLDHWSYAHTRSGWQDTLPSFDAGVYSKLGVAVEPLRYAHDGAAFYRIEGHLEQRVEAVLEALELQRQGAGLPFNVVAIAFDNTVANQQLDKDCRDADLEALYDKLREAYRCALEHEKKFFEGITPPPPDRGKVKGKIEKIDLPTTVTDRLKLKVLDTGEIFTADEAGNFVVELPEGPYVMQAFAGDYVGDRIFVDVKPGSDTVQPLNVRKTMLAGTAADMSTGTVQPRTAEMSVSATPTGSAPLTESAPTLMANLSSPRLPYRYAVPQKTVKEYIQDFIGLPSPQEAPSKLDLLDLAGTWTNVGKPELIQQIGLPARIALLLGQALTLLPDDLAKLGLVALQNNVKTLKSTAAALEKQLLDSKTALAPQQLQQLQHLQALQAFCHVELLATVKRGFDERREVQKKRLLFSEFLATHPSLEHLGGVPRGGTFVVAYQDGLVKADFALSYLCCDPCGPILLRIPDALPPPVDIRETLSFVSPSKTITVPEAVVGQVTLRAIITDPGALATLKVEDPAGKLRIEAKTPLFDLSEYTFEYLVQDKTSNKTALGKVFLSLINDQPLPKPADITLRTASAVAPITVKPPAALPTSIQVANATLSNSIVGAVTVEEEGKAVRFQPAAGFANVKRADITYTLRNTDSQRTVASLISILFEQALPTITLPDVTAQINRLYLKSTIINLPLTDKPTVIVTGIEPVSPSVGTLMLKGDRGPVYFTPATTRYGSILLDQPLDTKLPLEQETTRLEATSPPLTSVSSITATNPLQKFITHTITYKVQDTATGAKGSGRIILKFGGINEDMGGEIGPTK